MRWIVAPAMIWSILDAARAERAIREKYRIVADVLMDLVAATYGTDMDCAEGNLTLHMVRSLRIVPVEGRP